MYKIWFYFLIAQFSWISAHVTLRPMWIVQHDKIRVSDLFDGLEKEDLRPVRDAPAPGKKLTMEYAQLKDISQKMGIAWEPLVRNVKIIIKRESFKMPQDQLITLIKAALQKQTTANSDGNNTNENEDTEDMPGFDISLEDGNPSIDLPTDQETPVQVVDIQFSERRNRFIATLKTPYQTVLIHGHQEKMIEIPVLKEKIFRGFLISKHQIDTIRIPARELGRNTITNPSEIIGMRPKVGQILPFQPIASHYLEPISFVRKGDLVFMKARVHGIEISAKGRALESGGLHDVIRVENVDSQKVILGQVIGNKAVEVQCLESTNLRSS